MLEAWPALKSGAHLLVAGQDRAVQSYRNQAARLGVAARVSFLGAQSRVEDLFHAADAMAMPSLFEPFGNAVMEAMACGLPALTSAQSGVAELIPSELRQFVVNDPSDPREIAARLDALIEAAPALAGAARAAVEPFTWQRYGEGLIRLVESLR
jgi:UDP-glucose:(heptosyl)LPS alpha-1,3-glucosyltransferase